MQSGWRLAAREFAGNKLAVLGLAALIFFVVFCYLGPLVYHGALTSNLSVHQPAAGGPGTRSAPTTRASTCSRS